MRHPHRDRIEPLILLVIAVALFIAAFFSYRQSAPTDFAVDTPFRPGWLPVVMFVLIGVLVRFGYLAAGRSGRKKDGKGNASRQNLTNR
jgi:hypothetical protein